MKYPAKTLIGLAALGITAVQAGAAPELSTDLSLWNSGPAFFETLSEVDQGNGYKLITVKTLPAAMPRPAAFARLEISRS